MTPNYTQFSSAKVATLELKVLTVKRGKTFRKEVHCLGEKVSRTKLTKVEKVVKWRTIFKFK